MILLKVLGIILLIIGISMLTLFPAQEYQRSQMMKTGIWVGLVIFLIGIMMVVFG